MFSYSTKSWQGQGWCINFQYRVHDLYQEIEPSILPSIRLIALMSFHHHRIKLKTSRVIPSEVVNSYSLMLKRARFVLIYTDGNATCL